VTSCATVREHPKLSKAFPPPKSLSVDGEVVLEVSEVLPKALEPGLEAVVGTVRVEDPGSFGTFQNARSRQVHSRGGQILPCRKSIAFGGQECCELSHGDPSEMVDIDRRHQ
jgi:hypothetical protein